VLSGARAVLDGIDIGPLLQRYPALALALGILLLLCGLAWFALLALRVVERATELRRRLRRLDD
jgi:hypothetical protein